MVAGIESLDSREDLSQAGTKDRLEVPDKTWSDEWPRLRITKRLYMLGITSAVWPMSSYSSEIALCAS